MNLFGIIIFLQTLLFATASYAPQKVNCPANSQLTRSSNGSSLSPQEQTYITNRLAVAKQHLYTFLINANLQDFDVNSFLNQSQPTIGPAFSGGGYRSMLIGAGGIAAMDERTPSNGPNIKGLLQSSTYLAGLSGGAWLVGTLATNNLLSIGDLIAGGKLWELSSILDYYGSNFIKNQLMWATIAVQCLAKKEAGFDITITDPWGRALSYQFLATFSNNGDSQKWSDIGKTSSFQSYEMPFPLLVADGRVPDSVITNLNSTVFELTPYEVGSSDPSCGTFVQTPYIGSALDNGYPASGKNKCVNGFDNSGFFIGTSSSVFNEAILELGTTNLPSYITYILKDILSIFDEDNLDVANYDPNPFYKSHNATTPIDESSTLYLVDGASDGQNLPLAPLLTRKLDIIIAHDAANDNQNGWPDGTSLISTYQRQFSPQGANFHFPYVPDQYTFRNLNLTSKPTFFGCDAQNLTSLTSDIYDVPLVVYLANRPFTYWSNTSIFKLAYSAEERNAMIQNGYEISTRNNGTIDTQWPTCLACAVIRRQQERLGQEQSDQCKACFEEYCWSGEIYTGPDLGDNFSEDGVTSSSEYFNANNVAGFNDGGMEIL
ncbi:PLB2 [[Candida] subhashii]|uniref:Lysophospholipase n=1 Tax=[Candida] subhashii TaxID=561895 RepID=A0A8J5QIQ3_9ASCO|nr:PLB2 [[Candida] subhashii]KAG7666329.1 PLB2 [[Candida] subhashii]